MFPFDDAGAGRDAPPGPGFGRAHPVAEASEGLSEAEKRRTLRSGDAGTCLQSDQSEVGSQQVGQVDHNKSVEQPTYGAVAFLFS